MIPEFEAETVYVLVVSELGGRSKPIATFSDRDTAERIKVKIQGAVPFDVIHVGPRRLVFQTNVVKVPLITRTDDAADDAFASTMRRAMRLEA